ncbi:hypothetical protein HMPREF3224_02399 [Anaerococcus hydrogenalis]|nr:hypothetical protein HMPREF3224_02399 [Anaerococcus hydrogenalis]
MQGRFCKFLLVVQLDDKRFVNVVRERQFFTQRETGVSGFPFVEVLFNIGQLEGTNFLEAGLEHFIGTLIFFQRDDLTRGYTVRRDVNAFAVNENQTVVHHLASLTDRTREADTIDEVVQAAFEEEQKVFTNDAFHFTRFDVVTIELTFQ